MTVSRRLRFEILRRDNHACRYCGAVAPEVALTVDHVIPVALGGSDDPANLVTACRPCNSGKSSASLSNEKVEDIRQDALRWSRAMQAAAAERDEEIGIKGDYIDTFREAWDRWSRGGEKIPLPPGWRQSVEKWRTLGVSDTILLDALNDAMTFARYRGNEDDREFRFMAGIIWRTVEDLNLRTMAKLEQLPNGPYSLPEAYDAGWRACDRSYGAMGSCVLYQGYSLSAATDGPGWAF